MITGVHAIVYSRDAEADRGRREKIAAAKKGKPRPPSVGRAVAAAHLGTHHSAEARARQMSTELTPVRCNFK